MLFDCQPPEEDKDNHEKSDDGNWHVGVVGDASDNKETKQQHHLYILLILMLF